MTDPDAASVIADAPADTAARLFARAMARIDLGRDEEARKDLESASPDLGDRCRIELAYLDLRQRRDVREALAIAMDVIRQAAPGSALSARAHHVAGLAEGKLRRSGAAIDQLMQAARTYRELKDPNSRAQVFDTLGSVEAARGRLDLAVHFFALSLVDKSLLGDKVGMAITLGNIGRTHLRIGRFEDAEECFSRDLYLATEIGDPRGQARMHEDLGRVHLAAGDLPSAETEFQECIRLSIANHYDDFAFFAFKDLALLRIAQNRPDDAESLLHEAEKKLSPGAEPYLKQVLVAARGELALARRQPNAADLLQEAVDAFVAAELPDLEIPARIALAKAYLEQKLKATAENCLLKGMQRARADGYERYLPILKQEMARLDMSEGVIEERPRPIVASGQQPTGGTGGQSGEGYVVLEDLGSGTFGSVVRAYDPVRAKDVALKRFRLAKLYEVRRRKALIASAKLELEAASRVLHPGVVRITAIGFDEEGELYLVSDFVQGQSLRKVMSQVKSPALPVFLRYMQLMASALDALHEAGVVHRDLKPENVIITPDSLPVLVDFGIAHVSKWTGASVPSPGTPAYMAPEQARGAAVDPRADLYALGVIAYEWLAGDLPIRPKGPDMKQIILEVTATLPTPLKVRRPDLPAELSALVMQLLEKDPDNRPDSAAEVAEAFKKIPTATTARPKPTSKPPSKASSMKTTEPDLPN
jgi:tetratricopeptide (TPR) repeat protein